MRAEPFLRLEPESLDFFGTPIGTTAQKAFTLVNYGEGDGTYELTNDAAAFDFSVLGQVKGTIPAHSAIHFNVAFTPSKAYATPVGGAVKVNNSLICSVTGTTGAAGAAFQFMQTSLDFGYVRTSDQKLMQLAITNVGTSSGTYQLSLPAGSYSVSDDGTNPLSRNLAPGDIVTIQVVFQPQAETVAVHADQLRRQRRTPAFSRAGESILVQARCIFSF